MVLLLSAPSLAAQALRDTSSARPLRLEQLLEAVAGAHPIVEAARARVRAAQGSRATAGTFGNPFLNYQVENARLPGRSAPPMEREVMTTAMIPLEPLYQRPSRVRRANAEVEAARADAIDERQRVRLGAARAFYRTAKIQVERDVSQDLVAWLDTLVMYNASRAREGAVAEGDLIRSQLERDRAAAEGTMHEADLARVRAELATFLGDNIPRAGIVVAFEDAPLPFPEVAPSAGTEGTAVVRQAAGIGAATDTTRDAFLARALADRPSLRADRERLAASRAGVSSERTMLFRQLGAMLGTKQTAGTSSLVAGLSLPIPLFDQNRGEVRRALAERQAFAFELNAAERAVRAEVAGAYEAARLLTARVTTLGSGSEGFLARADEARRIALGAYREGATPLFLVLDAARTWGEARVIYYTTLFAQHEAVLELLVALGRDPLATPARSAGALR
jgi:outer membrane protein, heavy metal efflux system